MGCGSSHDAFVSKARCRTTSASSARRRGAGDPVALCRERVAMIRAAADRRFALASAHAAYFRSLAAVGGALRRFAEVAILPAATTPSSSSPVLTLPPRSPTKPAVASFSTAAALTSTLPSSPSSSSSTVSPLSHSLSYDDDDDLEKAAPLKATSSTRHYYYMRKSTTVPTVVYENPYGETRHGYTYQHGPYGEVVAEPEISPPPPPVAESSPWDFFDPFTSYDQFTDDYSRYKGVDMNFPTNSPNYSEVRRMEGIPELEDEAELEAEALKQSTTSGVADQNAEGKRHVPTNADSKSEHSERSLPRKGSGGIGKAVSRNDSVPINASSRSKKGIRSRSSTSSLKGTSSRASLKEASSRASLKGNDGGHTDGCGFSTNKKVLSFEEDRSVVAEEGNEGSHSTKSMMSPVSSESFSPLHNGDRDVRKAMEEIEERFGEAMEGGAEISKLLEVGKSPPPMAPRVLRYLSSKVVDPISLTAASSSCVPKRHSNSKASSSKVSITGSRNDHGNLSSTLEKLWIWEKKLYQEVKDEEKLRVLYKKKYRQLKSLDERGAEANVIDSVRLSARDLRSRISVNIKTASAFSAMIEKIRDEELYPQLVDLIQGLRRMWKVVLDCHRKQLFAIQDSKIHLLKAITISQSGAAAITTVELERELVKWYRCFNKWISSQRSYVEALNGWLKKWFPEVHEQDTTDGIPPFSPGKLGAAPVFIISNDWFQAIEMVPKNEMLRAIDHFSKLVRELKKTQKEEHRQKIKADHASRDYNKRREVLQRELELNTSLDMVAAMENNHSSNDSRVIELQKTRKRRDDEKDRHNEIIKHVDLAASATLPVGFVPVLEQIISFFEANLQFYMGIRTRAPTNR